jgi:hypothetical protein
MEPKRWLDEHENPTIRHALRVGAELAPPVGAEDAAWAGLVVALASSGAATVAAVGVSGAVTKPALSLLSLAKLFAMSFGAGLFVSGGVALVARSTHGNEPPRHVATSAPAAARTGHATSVAAPPPAAPPLAASPELTPEPTSAAMPAARSARASEPEEVARLSPPAPAAPSEESRIVLAAREALRRGDPARTLTELSRAEATFGTSGLAQERLALEIDAHLAAGKRDLAKQRAALFIERYPESPHSPRFRALR